MILVEIGKSVIPETVKLSEWSFHGTLLIKPISLRTKYRPSIIIQYQAFAISFLRKIVSIFVASAAPHRSLIELKAVISSALAQCLRVVKGGKFSEGLWKFKGGRTAVQGSLQRRFKVDLSRFTGCEMLQSMRFVPRFRYIYIHKIYFRFLPRNNFI